MGLLGALASVAGKQGVGLWVTLGLDKQQLETGLLKPKPHWSTGGTRH